MKKLFFISVLVLTQQATAQLSTWYPIPVNTTQKLVSIDFPSEMVGYIVGDSGVMLKTVNGGADWNPVNYSGIQSPNTIHFSDIDFVDDLNGFVVVRDNFVGPYYTSDGGQTWTEDQSTGNLCYQRCVYPLSADQWFLAGAGCFQSAMVHYRNTAGWTEKTVNYESFNPQEYIAQLDFNGNIGLAAMNAPYLLRSADGGDTWDTIPTNITGVHTSVHFLDAQTCYAGYDENGGGFGILVSTDAGLTWSQEIGSATFFYPAFLSVTSAANGDVYTGARPSNSPGGLIFEKSNGNWDYVQVDQPINDMTSYGTDITFGVGDSGLVVVNTQLSQLGLNDLKGSIGEDQLLVYPNPVKDLLYVDGVSSGELVIYDLNGREMMREPVKDALNVSSLPQGTYIIESLEAGVSIHQRFVKL